MHKGLKEPHLFNASSNPVKLINNLSGILTIAELDKLRREIDSNVIELFGLGLSHFQFACAIDKAHWRQRISRLYYGAYNVRRAIALKHNGSFSTDSSDHSKVDSIPDSVNDVAIYKSRLVNLREDRNLSDYNHLATEADLISSPDDYQTLVSNFISDAKAYLATQGIQI